MVTGRIVDYDPATKAYALPPEHVAWLTRAAGPNFLAATSQFTALLGEVEQQVIESFRNGVASRTRRIPGFTNVDITQIDGDLFNSYYIATKG